MLVLLKFVEVEGFIAHAKDHISEMTSLMSQVRKQLNSSDDASPENYDPQDCQQSCTTKTSRISHSSPDDSLWEEAV